MGLKQIFNRWRFGAVLDKCGPSGETALTFALKANDAQAAAEFIALGASPDQANAGGEYPLFLALKAGNFAAFRLLVETNADVHVIQNGRTAYDFAVEKGREAEAKIIAAAIRQDAEYMNSACACACAMICAPVFPPERSALFRKPAGKKMKK